jgi:hypothetical protein
MFTEPHGYMSVCFTNAAAATFIGNATDALYRLLWNSFRPGFHVWTPKRMFSSEDLPNVITIPYTFELLWNTLHIWDIHRAQRRFLLIRTTAKLRIDNRILEDNRWTEDHVSDLVVLGIRWELFCEDSELNPLFTRSGWIDLRVGFL